jgi:hypothetical protein
LSTLSILHPGEALQGVVFFHVTEGNLPPLSHNIGVAHFLVRQLQELDGFVVEALKIQLLHGIFRRSFVSQLPVTLNCLVEMVSKHVIISRGNKWPLFNNKPVRNQWGCWQG